MTVRRRTLIVGGLASIAGLAPTARSFGALATGAKSLSFHHLHTGERLRVTYREHGSLVAGAVDEIRHLLRDFRNGETHDIDVGLLDTLWILRAQLGVKGPFDVISGYRSPATNAMLRRRSRAVAKNSYHMYGRAIDVRLTGMDTKTLRDTALRLGRGGVGYYPKDDFVHIDTGRVRHW